MNKDFSIVAANLWIRGLRSSDKEYIREILLEVGYTDSFIDCVLEWLSAREFSIIES